MKILFICTSNRDRSPALEKYFRKLYLQHEYKSCGINEYFCSTKATQYVNEDLLKWADYVILAESIHAKVLNSKFDFVNIDLVYDDLNISKTLNKKYLILNCGEYIQEELDEYLLRAEEKLISLLTNN
jgi:predicted protein tyrosine phosphatase